jgi:hypothetical protein
MLLSCPYLLVWATFHPYATSDLCLLSCPWAPCPALTQRMQSSHHGWWQHGELPVLRVVPQPRVMHAVKQPRNLHAPPTQRGATSAFLGCAVWRRERGG